MDAAAACRALKAATSSADAADAQASMSCYQEEIFGPVLAVVRVPTRPPHGSASDANPYANGVALFTRDGHTARGSCTACRSAWWA